MVAIVRFWVCICLCKAAVPAGFWLIQHSIKVQIALSLQNCVIYARAKIERKLFCDKSTDNVITSQCLVITVSVNCSAVGSWVQHVFMCVLFWQDDFCSVNIVQCRWMCKDLTDSMWPAFLGDCFIDAFVTDWTSAWHALGAALRYQTAVIDAKAAT